MCRATVRLVTSWPIVDAKIMDSALVSLAGGKVMLDAERVWRPRMTVVGARQINLFSRRLELQSFGKSDSPHRILLQNSQIEFTSGGETTGSQGGSARRSIYIMTEMYISFCLSEKIGLIYLLPEFSVEASSDIPPF